MIGIESNSIIFYFQYPNIDLKYITRDFLEAISFLLNNFFFVDKLQAGGCII